jgi:hypothetical protein
MEWLLIVVLLTAGSGFAILGVAKYFFYLILCDVNGASTPGQQISFWRVGIKSLRILKRHRELFPESRKRLQMSWLTAVGLFLSLGSLIGGITATNLHWINN